jgi:hypothetical protein
MISTSNPIRAVTALCVTAFLLAAIPDPTWSEEPTLAPPFDPSSIDQGAMMKNMQGAMTPTTHHELLGVLAGEWTSETEMWMGGTGGQSMKTQGTVTNVWMLGERFLQSTGETNMMGQPMTGVILIGYDTFAQKYQMSSMSTMGTAMHHAEGYATPDGQSIVFYGQMDEPMLEVHGRTVKYVLRLEDTDHYVMEVHDLHIGEANTKVLETRFARKG